MIIIGERLNSSRKSVLEALQCRDREFVCEQAKKQEEAGVSYTARSRRPSTRPRPCWVRTLPLKAIFVFQGQKPKQTKKAANP